MKYQAGLRFKADYQRLTDEERALFQSAVRRINSAYASRGSRPFPEWPANLRIKRVRTLAGVFEMTWSFSGPDGRATFEFIDIDGEPAIHWRRIGDHSILEDP